MIRNIPKYCAVVRTSGIGIDVRFIFDDVLDRFKQTKQTADQQMVFYTIPIHTHSMFLLNTTSNKAQSK